jgi:hypothetical protein
MTKDKKQKTRDKKLIAWEIRSAKLRRSNYRKWLGSTSNFPTQPDIE